MEKQRTFQIIRRLSAPLLIIPAALLVHVVARFVWVWSATWPVPFKVHASTYDGFCDLPPTYTGIGCLQSPPRTIWNYNTDFIGVILSHILAVLLIVGVVVAAALVAALIQWGREFIQWAFEKPGEQASDANDAEEDFFISSCTNPHCPCPDHQERDRFDYGRNCWVEREDEDKAAAQPSPYATN